MKTAKKEIKELLDKQPDDATYEELIRSLAFELMISRGLTDSKERNTISNNEMKHRIQQWQI